MAHAYTEDQLVEQLAGLQRGQGLQVAAQHFGGDILLDCELRQTRYVFQVKAMLEPLEFKLIYTLHLQIQNLRRTRDLLLPRLLSGQINVELIPDSYSLFANGESFISS